MQNIKILKTLVVAFALAGTLAACDAASRRETTGEYVDDATITTKVKAAIFGEPSLKSMQITVETMQNVVQLSGFVDTLQERLKAGDIARNVAGVTGLRNNIVVR